MTLLVSVYDGESGTGRENRLHHWFRHENWSIHDGLLILCDVDPSSVRYKTKNHNNYIVAACDFAGRSFFDVFDDDALDRINSESQDIWSIWRSYDRDAGLEYQSPEFWVEWARQRKINVPWLDWAESSHLVSPKKSRIARETESKSQYSTPWLTILHAAVCEFFEPRRNPDAKKDEVVAWINARARDARIPASDNIAEAIFSVIKPTDHNPKRRSDKERV